MKRTGKLIAATSGQDVATLGDLIRRGHANGVTDLALLDGAEALALEPELRCLAAIHSPSTGILDTHQLMLALLGELESLGGMAKAIEAGIPKLRIEEASARTQARIDSGRQTVVGVNKYQPESEEPIDVLKVDNSAVRQAQIDKLSKLRAARDEAACQAALDALTKSAETGNGNLLGLAVSAAREKATVGEITDALERVYGRYVAEIRAISGVYSNEMGDSSDTVERVRAMVEAFERRVSPFVQRVLFRLLSGCRKSHQVVF